MTREPSRDGPGESGEEHLDLKYVKWSTGHSVTSLDELVRLLDLPTLSEEDKVHKKNQKRNEKNEGRCWREGEFKASLRKRTFYFRDIS